ncbi:MAG: O-antigen ligase family protein [Bacteroidales bacterium]|nr:O-antigen ligase family protein [Bacteroidales bacterium]
MLNNYDPRPGSLKLRTPEAILLLALGVVLISYLIATGGLVSAVALIMLPFVLIYLNRLFVNPRIGLISVIFAAFLAIGITRYLPVPVPLGLSVDGFLFLTYIALFFKYFYDRSAWKPIQNDLSLLALIWFLYAILEFFNPLALSRVAWFYAVRGFNLYMLMTIPLVFMLFNRVKYLNYFLILWGVLSILGTLKGMMQEYIGPDFAEQRWLNQTGAVTHIIFGRLRIFSFYSDAGQFGAAQGHAGIVGLLAATVTRRKWERIFYIIMGVSGLYGMMLSGTRGAIIVPFIGGLIFLIHRRNFLYLLIGAIILAGVFAFFRYTYLGQDNYYIRRMRTAFRPQEAASLQVRLENRALLAEYLKDKPFGGGIGSAGNWGRRFSPQGFLAQVPTDSWYVQIWAEQGIVGLTLHLMILAYIMIKGSYLIMARVKDPEIKGKLSALAAGIGGIMGASYGNGVLGQMPTGILIYTSMALIFMADQLDREMLQLRGEPDKKE